MIKIFVGGLPPEVSEIDLVTFISNYAEVVTIKMVRDKVSQKSKGYAFLEMKNQNEAEKAVSSLNEMIWKGNTLTVKISEGVAVKPQVKRFKPGNPVKTKRPRI